MGNFFGSLFSRLWGEQQVRILILGLDGAGKTTILYCLHLGEVVATVPTIGFNFETVNYKNLSFQVWDLGGQTSIRPYWRCYYADTQAIIYVVDSTDTARMGTAGQELMLMLAEEELKNAALVVLANKQDAPGAASLPEVSSKLRLATLKDRQWQIFRTSAIKNEGLTEALDWVVNAIRPNNNNNISTPQPPSQAPVLKGSQPAPPAAAAVAAPTANVQSTSFSSSSSTAKQGGEEEEEKVSGNSPNSATTTSIEEHVEQKLD